MDVKRFLHRHASDDAAGRRLARRAGFAGVVMTVAAALLTPAAPPAGSAPNINVVVTGPTVRVSADAVRKAGGEVTAELPLVAGVAARLPRGARLPAGLLVAPDRSVTFASVDGEAADPASTIRQTVGTSVAGQDGAGVTVAVVDTGVADVPDLRDRVVKHIDVTGTGDGDGYGHGTFLAGLIAGSGEGSAGAYRGLSPRARILDVKVADEAGSTSLTMVLQGLQAVADHGPRHGVRVLNLALASASPLPHQVDPLNQALRALWRRGVTVVVSSGNDGPSAGSVASPGNDPLLLTVGGVDEAGTAARDDDSVAEWSGRGPTVQAVAKPDLVAPGANVIGLRSPGSAIDQAYPQARVGDDYFRGSGTSMSAAVASAAVAQVLSANPRLSPDHVKQVLRDTAYRVSGLSDVAAAGSGGLDLEAAVPAASAFRPGRGQPEASGAPGDSRAWRDLADAIADGNQPAAMRAWGKLGPDARTWVARSWATADPTARSWAARSWAARSWAGSGGTADEWAARSWAARSWAARSWAARSWAARSWAGDDWAARSWAGDDWAARSWAGDDWAARSWASQSWAARSWAATWR